ncbi:MAG: hypothetical protein AB9836_12075 [Aminipila sp.]
MKNKFIMSAIFLCSIIALLISIKLFWNLGVYVDEANTTPSVICGGEFWLYMEWLRLMVLAVIVVFSGVKLLSK